MSSDPLVSVVIPAYAAAPYIRQTLDSVFTQKYPHYEVIVVNDGSPDTQEFEAAIADYRNRIVYIKQANRGPSAARNAGILRARGEFIAFLDSDDFWSDTYLDRQVEALCAAPGCDFIYADAFLVGGGVPSGRTFMGESPSRGPVTFDSLLGLDCLVISSCTVARREAILKAGLFDETLRHCEDFDLWLRIAFSGARMRYRHDVLATHRMHEGSLSASPQAMRKGRKRVYEKVAATLPLNEAQRLVVAGMLQSWGALIELEEGKSLLLEGKYPEALSKLRPANEYFRSGKIRILIVFLEMAPVPVRWLYHAYISNLASRRKKQ